MIPKFRAWHKKYERWIDKKTLKVRDDGIIFINNFPTYKIQENVILMQSTGLKDKNDKEIFEGDVVENEAMKDFVIFIDGVFTLNHAKEDKFAVRQPLASFGSINLHNTLTDMEVIGNIHENPELLEED